MCGSRLSYPYRARGQGKQRVRDVSKHVINMYETVPFFYSPYKSNTFNTQAYLGNARRNPFFIIRAELREQQQVVYASQKHVDNSSAVADRGAKTNETKRLLIRVLNAASCLYGLRFLRVGKTHRVDILY